MAKKFREITEGLNSEFRRLGHVKKKWSYISYRAIVH